MGLYRTALRLATLESLRPASLNGTEGPWPTLAGSKVFDTRIDPWEGKPDEICAVVAVYTENDVGYSSQKAGGPPFKHEVDLVFEIAQIAFAASPDDPQVFEARFPVTDQELEATLDTLEFQIEDALLNGGNGVLVPWSNGDKTTLWRALTGSRVREPKSLTHRTTEEAVRLARRTVTWKVEIDDADDDHYPQPGAKGLDRLPQPMRSVAYALAGVQAYETLIGGIAGAIVPRAPLPQLKGINANVRLLRPNKMLVGAPDISAKITFPLWTWRK